mgnify:CR=1 FL=1
MKVIYSKVNEDIIKATLDNLSYKKIPIREKILVYFVNGAFLAAIITCCANLVSRGYNMTTIHMCVQLSLLFITLNLMRCSALNLFYSIGKFQTYEYNNRITRLRGIIASFQNTDIIKETEFQSLVHGKECYVCGKIEDDTFTLDIPVDESNSIYISQKFVVPVEVINTLSEKGVLDFSYLDDAWDIIQSEINGSES